MANYLIKEETLISIADAIRGASGGNGLTIDPSVIYTTDLLHQNAVTVEYFVTTNNNFYEDDHGWYLAAYDYLEDNDGDLVPVLYKDEYNGLGIDYDEPFFYEGVYEGPQDGQLYDRWRKIEFGDNVHYTWDSQDMAWIYTNRIVRNGDSNTYTVEQMPNKIKELDRPACCLTGYYVLKSSFTSKDLPDKDITQEFFDYGEEGGYDAYFYPSEFMSNVTYKMAIGNFTIGPNGVTIRGGEEDDELYKLYYSLDNGYWSGKYDADDDWDPTICDTYRILQFYSPYYVSPEFYEAFHKIITGESPFTLQRKQTSAAIEGILSTYWNIERNYSISHYAFLDSPNLQYANLSECTSIGSYAFADCHSLKGVYRTNTVSYYGNQAFGYCSQLSYISISGAATIGAYAFINCINLSRVDLNKCSSIASNAFSNCTNLTSVYIYTVGGSHIIPSIGQGYPFPSTTKVYVPSSMYSKYKGTGIWSQAVNLVSY